MKMKSISITVPILWALTTGIWAVNIYMKISAGETQGYLFVLQCVCVIVSCAAAVANFIRYRRSTKSKDE